MPKFNINFTDTPDSIPPIPPGTYVMDIVGIPKEEVSKKGTSTNLIVDMKIVHDDPVLNGRTVRHFINRGTTAEGELRANIMIKHLCQSAGLELTPDLETEALAGARVKAKLKPRTYLDDNQVTQQSTEVVEYLKD